MTTPDELRARGLVQDRTDVDAAADLAAEPTIWPISAGDHSGIALPPGWTWETDDAERFLFAPRRSTGTIRVYDAASFVAAVERRRTTGVDGVVVYADEDALDLVAVLNDDDSERTGWRDYRVGLSLRETPEWKHWAAKDGRMLDQEAFAEHVELGLAELRDPTGAVMLDIAQTLHATINVRYKSGRRLADGRTQFQYDEDIEANAGAEGLAIPSELTLAIPPFVGGPAYEVKAMFRYRLPRGGGDLSLGYALVRPHQIKRAAFLAIRDEVNTALDGALVLAGPAPAER